MIRRVRRMYITRAKALLTTAAGISASTRIQVIRPAMLRSQSPPSEVCSAPSFRPETPTVASDDRGDHISQRCVHEVKIRPFVRSQDPQKRETRMVTRHEITCGSPYFRFHN